MQEDEKMRKYKIKRKYRQALPCFVPFMSTLVSAEGREQGESFSIAGLAIAAIIAVAVILLVILLVPGGGKRR